MQFYRTGSSYVNPALRFADFLCRVPSAVNCCRSTPVHDDARCPVTGVIDAANSLSGLPFPTASTRADKLQAFGSSGNAHSSGHTRFP